MNKPAKSFLKEQFSIWYSEQLFKQFEDQSDVPLDDVTLNPVDFGLANMKNISAKWLVEAAKYIANNPQFIVNGFVHAGICRALDGQSSDDELDELLHEMDSSLEVSTTSDEHEVETVESTQSSDEELYSNHNTHDQQQDKDQNQSAAFDSPVIVLYSSSSEEDV